MPELRKAFPGGISGRVTVILTCRWIETSRGVIAIRTGPAGGAMSEQHGVTLTCIARNWSHILWRAVQCMKRARGC